MRLRNPPDWFSHSAYDVPRSLAEWYHALAVRRNFFSDIEQSAKDSDANSVIWGDALLAWADFQSQLAASQHRDLPTGRRAVHRLEAAGTPDLLTLAIDLNAPASLIRYEVAVELNKAQAAYKPALSDSGPPPALPRRLNLNIDAILESWRAYRILALFDLCLWHSLHDGRRPPWADLGRWLYSEAEFANTDTQQRAREAFAVMDRALFQGCDFLPIAAAVIEPPEVPLQS
jgi:hypothetical protein